jgi:hypothetical protein
MSTNEDHHTDTQNNEEKQYGTQAFHPYHQIKREPSHR